MLISATPTDAEIWRYLEAIEDNLSSHNAPPPIPPRIRIRSLSETQDGISIEIENLGDSVDALVSVADSRGTIIGTPYQMELSDWDDPRRMDFRLLSRDEQINLLVDAGGKLVRLPLFIRKQVAAPRIVAFPLAQTVNVGESVEYTLVIEGDPHDRGRYPITLADLPRGMARHTLVSRSGLAKQIVPWVMIWGKKRNVDNFFLTNAPDYLYNFYKPHFNIKGDDESECHCPQRDACPEISQILLLAVVDKRITHFRGLRL